MIRQQVISTHDVFTYFSLSKCCCLHFCRNEFGLLLTQGYFKGERSSVNHKLQLFMTLCDQYAIIEWYLLDAPTSTHGVITSFSAAACISGGIKFGRMLA